MLQTLKSFAQGRKTIWIARFYTFAGIAVLVKDAVDAQGIDLSKYLPPELTGASWWPWFMVATGLLFEGLRRITVTAPLVVAQDTDHA